MILLDDGWYSKKYTIRLCRIYARTVHHRSWLASSERLKYTVYECKHLYIPLTWNVWKHEQYVVDVFLACLEFFVPLENFSLIWGRHHFRWKAANFDLCSALMAIEQWWFFSVSHLLWHRASVYNGHRGPMTLTPNAAWLALSCHYLFFCTT